MALLARYPSILTLLAASAAAYPAMAEEPLAVKFPQGVREECSTPAIGRFTVEGPGLVTVRVSLIPYKSLGYTPNVPIGWWLVSAGSTNFGPTIPLPGFQRTRYIQLGQEVSNWADNVPLEIESEFLLEEPGPFIIDVKGGPQCWMMPQNIYWQEGQELHVEVTGGAGIEIEGTRTGFDEDEDEEDEEDEQDTASLDIPGIWTTSEGNLTLELDGSSVRGSYDVDEGRIEGTLDGDLLSGHWGEAGSARQCDTERLGTFYWGRIEWTFGAGTFAGNWGYCEDEPTGAWTGSKRQPD